MADDNTVEIKFEADASGFGKGTEEAKESLGGLKGATDEAFGDIGKIIQGATEPLRALVDGLGGLHEALIDVTGFEIFKKALEEIRAPFEKIAELSEDAIKSNVSTELFARSLGVGATEAQGLAAALQLVGQSSESYSTLALRLDQNVRQNEERMNQLGVTTRDANGELLNQQQIMSSAFSALDEFKDGTDRNSASLEIFGRRSNDVLEIQRANGGVQRELTQDIVDQGAAVTETTEEAAEAAETAGGRLHDVFGNFADTLGDDVNPSLAALENSLADVLIPILNSVRDAFDFLLSSIDLLISGARVIGDSFMVVFKDIIDSAKSAASVFADLAKGNFEGALDDARMYSSQIRIDNENSFRDMAQTAVDYKKRMDELFSDKSEHAPAPPEKPKNHYHPPPKDDGKSDDAGDDDDSAELRAQQRSAEIIIETDAKTAEARLATERDLVKQKADLHQIDAQTEYSDMANAAAQELAIQRNKYDRLAELYAGDADKQTQIAASRVEAEQKYDQQIIQLRTRAAQQNQRTENTLVQTISRGLNQTVTGVLTGTQTMAQAFGRLAQNIVLSMITGALDKVVTSWLANNATIQAAQSALTSFLDISNATNAESAVTTAQASTHANITAYAGEGAAAAIASTSAIPLVGPELAPEAGAAIYADIMAFDVASAAGGWVVPSDQLAMVHENEMILPAHLSQGIAGMIAGGQDGGGTTNHFNFAPQINGKLGPDDIDGLHKAFGSFVQKGLRNGQFGSMRKS